MNKRATTEVFHGTSETYGDSVHIVVTLPSGIKHRLQISISPTGRSVRVFRDGKELVSR